MKIETNNYDTIFSILEIGDVFVADNRVYVRMFPVQEGNAFCLSNNELYYFDDMDKVQPKPEAKLILE